VSSRIETRTGGRPASGGVIPGDFAPSVGRPERPEPPGWRWTALADVARLETGHTPSRKHPEYWGGGVPWIGIKDATENHGRVIADTHQHTNELGIANSSARVLPTYTVCLSRTASVGYVVVMGKPMATSQDFVNWVCSEAIDHRFLKYVLLAEREAFLRFASGTTHQTIYFPEVKAFHVCLPPIEEQRAIAHILGTLDDKIELNRRMNETLEAMARALFQSWFVDFDPVRAKAEGREAGLPKHLANLFPNSLADSSVGEIPKGWAARAWGALATLEYGRALRGYDRQDGAYPVYGTNGRIGAHTEALCPHPGVIIGRKGAYRGVHYCDTPFFAIDTAFYLAPRAAVELRWAYYELLRQDINSMDSGSAIPSTSREDFYGLPVVAPPPDVQRAFVTALDPAWRRQRANIEEVATLAALRDTLLPQLISGELRVQDADKFLERNA
jgi:type I restriction enzyme, S subunit